MNPAEVLDELERRPNLEADDDAGATMAARSLAQMHRAGLPVAMIPAELMPDVDLPSPPAGVLPCLATLDDLEAERAAVVWVCLVERDHDGPHPWPPADRRAGAVEALRQQTDPLERIARRAAAALQPALDPLAVDMPPA